MNTMVKRVGNAAVDVLLASTGARMRSGYLGFGVGAAGSGSQIMFGFRSVSADSAISGARTVTASDYRALVRN